MRMRGVFARHAQTFVAEFASNNAKIRIFLSYYLPNWKSGVSIDIFCAILQIYIYEGALLQIEVQTQSA